MRDYLNSEESAFKDFKELSFEAWKYSSQINEEKKTSRAAFLRWFRPLIQALKDLGGSATPADARKKIAENESLTKEEITPNQKYKMSGNKISVMTLDLNMEFGKIKEQLDMIAEEHFGEAVSEMQGNRKDGQ